ncbi:Fibronectin type III,Immunoglobulin-like fold [Cinara cedri]|uniref:Fibronectin type III,Immunoglobulin-like fold n=1 Tax=Cinara cedri TaxID=506608 RepID=A0A5E4NS12_9HEMI|nr:Fibronectin type III,Immunoglobulin-like fold [Cinara cedri]
MDDKSRTDLKAKRQLKLKKLVKLPILKKLLIDNSAQQGPSVGPVFDQLFSPADNLRESSATSQKSLIQQTQGQIVPVGREYLIEGNRQQMIPVTEYPNTVVELKDSGVDLNQQSVSSKKDSESKDLDMINLSKFLNEEPSQNVEPPFINVQSKYIKNGEQKKIKNPFSENNPNQKYTMKYKNDTTDTLLTLATATLDQVPPTNGSADSSIAKPTQPTVHAEQEIPAWCDVGIFKGTACMVKQFYSTSITDEHEFTNLDHLPDYTNKLKIDIQPGTAYKFRIAAINSCGRGEWSEISAFKTCLPGYPSIPSAIKITKAPDGAIITWNDQSTYSDKILDYTVCMAIENPEEGTSQNPKPTTTNFNFVRVYCGPQNVALVSHESLGAAFIDRTNKPSIIFRVIAKNEKGYGPALQVRWLQDDSELGLNENLTMKKRK